MSAKVRTILFVLFCGLILGNIVMASSSSFEHFTPFQLGQDLMYGAAFVIGILVGLLFPDVKALLGVLLAVVLLGVTVYGAAIVYATGLLYGAVSDVVYLYAFQQAMPRLLFICVIGYVGAFLASIVTTHMSPPWTMR